MSNLFMEVDDFYNRVRNILSTTEEEIPDETIDRYEYSGTAKNFVNDKLSDTSGYTSEQKEILYCCYIYRTAIELLPLTKSEKDVKLEQTTHSKTEYFKNSYDDTLDMLSEKLSTYLSLLGYSSGYTPTIFTTSNTDDVYEGDTYHI